MTLQFGTTLRNALNDQIETTIGTSARLQIWSGSAPANCGTADSGTKGIEATLPSDYLAASSAGVKSKSGTWSGTGLAAITAGYFRMKDSSVTTCHMQGTVGTSGTDMTIDNTSIAVSQVVTVNTFDLTAPGA